MRTVSCPRCAAERSADARFCVRCGLDLDVGPAQEEEPAPDAARFVTCSSCGATNAASRVRCARCKVGFDAGTPPLEDLLLPPVPPALRPTASSAEPDPGSPVVYGTVVTLAALAIIGVMATLLSGNGIGFFGDALARPQVTDGDVTQRITAIRASSVLHASEVDHLLDGDPTTSWREAADGDGVGEWIELELEGNPEVSRVVVWNGDQREGRFDRSGRAARVRLDLGKRTFTAELLDVSGPQAIELPELVATSSIRLTILDVVAGDGDLALSGLEVRGPPKPAPDVDG